METLSLHRAKGITGWMSDAELLFLAEQAIKAKVIFEIGSFHGRSTRAMADNMPSGGKLYAIDPWGTSNFDATGAVIFDSDETTYNVFHCNMADHIRSKRVIPIRSFWENWTPPVDADFIFIDGDHRYKTVVEDITKALQYLEPGSILAGHDYSNGWPEVVQAVNHCFAGKNLYLMETIWWAKVEN